MTRSSRELLDGVGAVGLNRLPTPLIHSTLSVQSATKTVGLVGCHYRILPRQPPWSLPRPAGWLFFFLFGKASRIMLGIASSGYSEWLYDTT